MAKGLESKQDMGQTPKQVIRLASCSCIFVFCLAPCFACRALLFEGYLSADHLVSDPCSLFPWSLFLTFLGLTCLGLTSSWSHFLALFAWPYSLCLRLASCVPWASACLGSCTLGSWLSWTLHVLDRWLPWISGCLALAWLYMLLASLCVFQSRMGKLSSANAFGFGKAEATVCR
jgi:hypothetical protein